jgi:hypothetical protein
MRRLLLALMVPHSGDVRFRAALTNALKSTFAGASANQGVRGFGGISSLLPSSSSDSWTVLMSRHHRGGSHMRIGSCVIAVLLAATSAVAHHSNSAFDGDKVMVLTGTVAEWKWTNPHVWIFLSVDDGNGGKVQWEIEGRTPGQLVRAGWSRTTLKAGETITVDFSPAKDGTRTGLLTRVRRADGTVVGQQAPPAAQ